MNELNALKSVWGRTECKGDAQAPSSLGKTQRMYEYERRLDYTGETRKAGDLTINGNWPTVGRGKWRGENV